MNERKRALVVGIDAYQGGIPTLRSAVRDAEAVAEQLAQAHGYEVELLIDDTATAEAILASLAGVAAAGLTADDSFVVYFAGHGIAEESDGTDLPQGFLLASDARPSKRETWLGMDSLRAVLDKLECRHLMLVLDCCYAGAIRWTSTRSIVAANRPLYRSQYERYRQGIAWHVLTSALHDEKADDVAPFTGDRGESTSPGEHSPFAQALIDGLSGNAADSSRGGMAADGVITATELHQFIYEKVAVNDRQTPGIYPLKPDNKGEFVFLAPGVELNLEPDPPLDDHNNPWLGVEPYSPDDHELFFGRDEATQQLTAQVAARRFVAVVGASGSGKSSLIRAGLLPVLTAGAWAVVEAGPLAPDPTEQLATAKVQLAAAPASERQLLVIDQFEVLFTQSDETMRRQFLSSLREVVESEGGPTVLIAVRSDFEPRAAAELGELWASGATYPVPDFSADDLRSIALGPALATAVFFEPADLIDRLVDEVTKMPGAAPLFSLTLAKLYSQARSRRRETGATDRMITDDDVEAVGGVVGVTEQRAGARYDAADTPGKAMTRRIFLRLVSEDTDGLKRRRVHRDELEFGAELDGLVSRTLGSFVAARLLVVGSDGDRVYVESAHDALVTTWHKQLEWLDQSGSQKVIRRAWEQANIWEQNGRRASSKRLWAHDADLPRLEVLERNQELNALERDFLRASATKKQAIRRGVILITAAVIAALTVAGVAFYLQRNEARQQARVATSRQLAATAVDLTGTDSHDQALLLAAEGFRIGDGQAPRDPATVLNQSTVQSFDALLGGVARWPAFARVLTGHEDAVRAAAISGDGRVVATADAGGLIALWDTATGELRADFRLDDAIPAGSVSSEQLRQLALDDDGTVVAAVTGADGEAVWVWDTAGGARSMTVTDRDLAPSEFEARAFENLSLSADGARLMASQVSGATVWDTSTGDRVNDVTGNGFVDQARLSPDAQLAVIGGEGAEYLVAVDDPGVQIARLDSARRFGAAFSPDGCTVALLGGRSDGQRVVEGIWFFDLDSLAFWPDPIPLDEPVSFLAFSPDGQRLTASIGPSRGPQMLTVWDLPQAAVAQGDAAHACPIAEPFAPFEIDVETPVRAVAGTAFTPDGAVLAVAPTPHGAFVWDASADPAAGEVYQGNAVALSPDGSTVVFAAPEDEPTAARVVDLVTGAHSSIPISTNEYGNVPTMAVNDGGSRVRDVRRRQGRHVGHRPDHRSWDEQRARAGRQPGRHGRRVSDLVRPDRSVARVGV